MKRLHNLTGNPRQHDVISGGEGVIVRFHGSFNQCFVFYSLLLFLFKDPC